MSERTLLSNNLADIEEAYEFNFKKYKKRLKWFIVGYICHISAPGALIFVLIINLYLR